MDKFEQEANEVIENMNKVQSIQEKQKIIIERLKQWYNYGKGYKRDRMFLSKEKHEKKYNPKRKTFAKVYKKKEV